jgi:similar to stage IV sporulation protein
MLLEKVTNRLRGEVRFRVTSDFPERVLNLCGAHQLSFWNVKWETPAEFTCTMSRQDFDRLERLTEKLDCTLTVKRRQGAPFFMNRLRRRQALLCGLLFCAVLLMTGSFFIWDFRIEGNERVTDEEILRALEKNGVTMGTFGFSIDGENLRNHVLLEIPELSWIAVNVSGCQAQVQVRERVPAPELADKRTPTNIVARRDGLILRMEALGGQKLALPGMTVTAGQLLISGIRDTDTFGARLMAGMGTVTARTWYTLTTVMPLEIERKTYTGEEQTRLSLIFGTHRVKFYANSSHYERDYDRITARTKLNLLGLSLPLIVEEETLRFYRSETAACSPQEAEGRGEQVLKEYLHTLVDGSVRSTLTSSHQQGNLLTVTLTAECEEQIGRKAPIYTDTDAPEG